MSRFKYLLFSIGSSKNNTLIIIIIIIVNDCKRKILNQSTLLRNANELRFFGQSSYFKHSEIFYNDKSLRIISIT